VSRVGDSELQARVREMLEGTAIDRNPFPHVVVQDILPEPFFRQLRQVVPAVAQFEPDDEIKANLRISEGNTFFDRAPTRFRSAWSRLRDDVFRDVVAPVLSRRLADDIREKYATLFSPDVAEEIVAAGFGANDGRIMARKRGYNLRPHSDPAHFAITLLLYFTAADDASSGALCLFKPERKPELRKTGTYYPEREEGIGVELVREIPIRENLFVAFVNTEEALHGVRIEPGAASEQERLAYQAHVVPLSDPRLNLERYLDRLEDPAAIARWRDYHERRSEKLSAKRVKKGRRVSS
jgi:hypothetical protein